MRLPIYTPSRKGWSRSGFSVQVEEKSLLLNAILANRIAHHHILHFEKKFDMVSPETMGSPLRDVKWIWVKDFDDTVNPGTFVLFRKAFHLDHIPSSPIPIHVSADTRYRLFVNGQRVAFGPCKSYLTRWYYETVDIKPFLREGKNAIAVRVLRFSPAHAGNSSMTRANIPGLILHGRIDVSVWNF